MYGIDYAGGPHSTACLLYNAEARSMQKAKPGAPMMPCGMPRSEAAAWFEDTGRTLVLSALRAEYLCAKNEFAAYQARVERLENALHVALTARQRHLV